MAARPATLGSRCACCGCRALDGYSIVQLTDVHVDSLIHLQWEHVAGLYRHGDGQLVVSRGTGFWGPPLRLGSPPEILKIVLTTWPTLLQNSGPGRAVLQGRACAHRRRCSS